MKRFPPHLAGILCLAIALFCRPAHAQIAYSPLVKSGLVGVWQARHYSASLAGGHGGIPNDVAGGPPMLACTGADPNGRQFTYTDPVHKSADPAVYGLDTIAFTGNGTSTLSAMSAAQGLGSWTILVAGQVNLSAYYATLLFDRTYNNDLTTGGNLQWYMNGATAFANYAIGSHASNQYGVYSVTYDQPSGRLRIGFEGNGLLYTSTAVTTGYGMHEIGVGLTNVIYHTTTSATTEKISLVVAYNTVLTDAQISAEVKHIGRKTLDRINYTAFGNSHFDDYVDGSRTGKPSALNLLASAIRAKYPRVVVNTPDFVVGRPTANMIHDLPAASVAGFRPSLGPNLWLWTEDTNDNNAGGPATTVADHTALNNLLLQMGADGIVNVGTLPRFDATAPPGPTTRDPYRVTVAAAQATWETTTRAAHPNLYLAHIPGDADPHLQDQTNRGDYGADRTHLLPTARPYFVNGALLPLLSAAIRHFSATTSSAP